MEHGHDLGVKQVEGCHHVLMRHIADVKHPHKVICADHVGNDARTAADVCQSLLHVRHDFLRQQLEMFHFVEHRIQHEMLCAGLDQRTEFVQAFVATTPDTDA